MFVNMSLRTVDDTYLEKGLLSQFVLDLFSTINLNFLDNIFIYFFINFLLLIFGIFLIFLSFKLSFSWINKIVYSLRILKYFKFLFSIFSLFKYLKFKNKVSKKTLRSEPTIKKRNYVNLNRKNINKPKTNKQLELDNFSFTLPSKNLLSKSIIEITKIKN